MAAGMHRGVTHAAGATCLLLAVLTLPARGAEVHVPSQYATIQAAISAAAFGDQVVIAPGTYTGSGNRDLDYHGKAITVRSTDPTDPAVVAATVIDCQGSTKSRHRGVVFRNGEGPDAVLAGLTIRGGVAPLEEVQGTINSFGGGIFCSGASPTIRACVIRDNKTGPYSAADSGGHGGGIYCVNAAILLDSCTITGNSTAKGQFITATGKGQVGQGGGGGGIYCLSSSLTLRHCTITSNSTGDGGDGKAYSQFGDGGHGAGICAVSSSLDIADTILSDNQAGNGANVVEAANTIKGGRGGNGGAIDCPTSSLLLTDCRIEGNLAGDGGGSMGYGSGGPGGHGGGLSCGFATIANCLIAGNDAGQGGFGEYGGSPSGGHGGGIYGTGEVTITCSTIVDNEAGQGGATLEPSPGIGGDGGGIHAAMVSLSNCIVANNAAGDGGEARTTYSSVNSADGGNGGGVFCQAGAIRYCLFANNAAGDGPDGDSLPAYRSAGGNGGAGGAVYGASALHCTFANNRAGIGGQGYYGGTHGANGSGNDIVGGTADCTFIATGGAAYDLGFVDADGPDNKALTWQDNDYHLAENSPCIDVGDPDFTPTADQTDLDGQPRVAHGRLDLGADEFLLPGDIDANSIVNTLDLLLLARAWSSHAGEAAYALVCDLNGDGYVDLIDLRTLAGSWGREIPE